MRQNAKALYSMLARSVVLEAEQPVNFWHTLAASEAAFAPRNIWERDLVFDIVCNRWRQRRICTVERAILDAQISRTPPGETRPEAAAGHAYRASVDQSRVL